MGMVGMSRVPQRFARRSWGVRMAAVSTALIGAMNIFSAITPPLADRLAFIEQFTPLEVEAGGRLITALAGFALLLLGQQLWRRKRVAWLLTLIILILSAISHLLKGLDYEEASLATALAIWLLVQRVHFYARTDPPSLKRGLQVLFGALLFTLTYGVAGFSLLDITLASTLVSWVR